MVHIDRCVCTNRTFASLLEESQQCGYHLRAVIEATGASAQCGLCGPYLRRALVTGQTVFREILSPQPSQTADKPARES